MTTASALPDDDLPEPITGLDGKQYRITNNRERHGSGVVQSTTPGHRHTVVSDDVVDDIRRSVIADGVVTVTLEQWSRANGYDPTVRSYLGDDDDIEAVP